jgi:very-short-patch-repair endonuclease
MLRYAANLKGQARKLRKKLTESESALWSCLRGKQLLGIQFYRQKPIGQYIVDFFAPKARLVIEVDGSQHMEKNHLQKDKTRDEYLTGLGLKVLRFNSRAILTETEAVMEVIYRTMTEQLNSEIPPAPLCQRGAGGIFSKGGIERKPFGERAIKMKC